MGADKAFGQYGERETFAAKETPICMIGIVAVLSAGVSCGPSLAQKSPVNDPAYRKMSCPELAQEDRAISKRGFEAAGLRAALGGSDATLTTSAVVYV